MESGKSIKRVSSLWMAFLLGLTMMSCSTARTSEATPHEALNVQSFRVDVDFMHPQRWSSRSVWDYWVSVSGDSIECHLPYMGVAYQSDFYNEGLNFHEPIIAMQQKPGKKGRTELLLECKRRMFAYRFRFTLYPKGQASIYLLPSNGDGISYEGDWRNY